MKPFSREYRRPKLHTFRETIRESPKLENHVSNKERRIEVLIAAEISTAYHKPLPRQAATMRTTKKEGRNNQMAMRTHRAEQVGGKVINKTKPNAKAAVLECH